MRFDGRARRWVEDVTGRTVVRARRMPGGASSAVHEVVLADGGRVVLRRTIGAFTDVPTAARTEAELEVGALRRLAGWDLVPELLASDLAGEACGAPSVLVTRLPGRPWTTPGRRPEAWVDGLAAAVRAVHDLDLDLPGADADLPAAVPWFHGPSGPPPWTMVPEAWEWADATLDGSLPASEPGRLVHRDLHPGNVLFDRGRLTGIVDWEAICRGPVELDVSRCRAHVAVLGGLGAADAFLARLDDLVPTYDRRWDAFAACELRPWTEDLLTYTRLGATLTLADIRSTLDTLVARAQAGTSSGARSSAGASAPSARSRSRVRTDQAIAATQRATMPR